MLKLLLNSRILEKKICSIVTDMPVISAVKIYCDTVVVGCDHAGYSLKQHLLRIIQQNDNLRIVDVGAYDTEPTNYPNYAHAVANYIQENPRAMGILICGTGIGMCITVNRYPFIRGALCHESLKNVTLSRQHNNANVLCLGGDLDTVDFAIQAVQVFLTTAFTGGRHQERISLINRGL